MQFFVIIATANRVDLLIRTLDSICGCDLPVELERVIVVENGERTGAEEAVSAFANRIPIHYMHEPEANKSSALNAALELIDSGLVFFTDDDVRLHDKTLIEYRNAALDCPEGTFFGGPVSVDYEIPPPSWLTSFLPPSAVGWSLEPGSYHVTSPILLGANWAVFASDLKAAGGFNRDRGPGAATGSVGQEAEMQRQLFANGRHGKYLPNALVWHYVPADRCTCRWALNRAYRHGVQWGLRSQRRGRRIFGIPQWVIRDAGSSLLRGLRNCVTLDRSRVFMELHELNRLRGVVHGQRIVMSEKKTKPISNSSNGA